MLNLYDKYESKIPREKFYSNASEKTYTSNSNINPIKKHRFKTIKTNELIKTGTSGTDCGSGGGGGTCGLLIDESTSKIKNAKSKSCVDTSKPSGAYLPYHTSSGKYSVLSIFIFKKC